MLENGRARRQGRPAGRVVVGRIEPMRGTPVDRAGQLHQRMAHVDDRVHMNAQYRPDRSRVVLLDESVPRQRSVATTEARIRFARIPLANYHSWHNRPTSAHAATVSAQPPHEEVGLKLQSQRVRS